MLPASYAAMEDYRTMHKANEKVEQLVVWRLTERFRVGDWDPFSWSMIRIIWFCRYTAFGKWGCPY
jgi:hypothetical protein